MNSRNISQISILRSAVEQIAAGSSQDLTVRQLLVLLRVGSQANEVTQQQLADHSSEYKSTISRIVSHLAGSEGSVPHKNGLGLLRVDMDSQDLRNRLVSLSKEGALLLTRACKSGFGDDNGER